MVLEDLKENFDLFAYLDDQGISYATEGKNVTSGWLELECPFCGDDPSKHLGINLSTNTFSCWRCSARGDIISLIQELEQCYFAEAKERLEEYQLTELRESEDKETYQNTKVDFECPVRTLLECPEIQAQKYLMKRRFNPVYLANKYGLLIPKPFYLGKYSHRIIVPMHQDGLMVNFAAMDILRSIEDREKYKNCPNDKAVIPISQCWYNIDNVRDKAVLVEGVTDVWRLGDGAIASMGVEFPMEQLLILARKKPKRVYTLYDSEVQAQKQARMVADKVSSTLGIKVEVLCLDSGDPADLSDEDAQILMRSL